jgi:AraC-like DNA-binding protein
MTLLIDTGVVPAPHRVEFWAKSSHDVYHPLRIRAEPTERFSARMWGDWLAPVGVFRIAAEPNTMSRSRADIAAGDPECVHLSILLRGRLDGAQQHRTVVLRPGDMTSYDTSQPAVFSAPEAFDLLVLKFPKATLGKDAARISRLTAIRIPGECGLPRLAARFFCGAAAGLADGSISRQDEDLAEHIIDLVRRLYVDLGASVQPTPPRSRAELLLAAQAYIEANLRDPSLNPDLVARACFISTRYLHRLFEDEGLSVCGSIRRARLDHCRRDLLNPAFADQSISMIASRWGLSSAPHFSRLFRMTYGCSARDFRRYGQGDPPSTMPDGRTPSLGSTNPLLEHAEAWAAQGWEPTPGHGIR